MMKIFLHDIHIRARHGVMPQERIVGTDFCVSLEVLTDDTRATLTDELAHTANYADMARTVQEEMARPSRLVEHVAGRIARRILDEQPTLRQVTVSVTKEQPPIAGLQCGGAGVKLTLTRQNH